jgi:hypothetical protein
VIFWNTGFWEEESDRYAVAGNGPDCCWWLVACGSGLAEKRQQADDGGRRTENSRKSEILNSNPPTADKSETNSNYQRKKFPNNRVPVGRAVK